MIPKHVIIVFYRHHENHNNLLEILKDYLEKIPYIQFRDPTLKCECYVLPAHRGIQSVLHYLDNCINSVDYFQWDIFEYFYNKLLNIHDYYGLRLSGRSDWGLIYSPRMEFTLDYLKKLEELSED